MAHSNKFNPQPYLNILLKAMADESNTPDDVLELATRVQRTCCKACSESPDFMYKNCDRSVCRFMVKLDKIANEAIDRMDKAQA